MQFEAVTKRNFAAMVTEECKDDMILPKPAKKMRLSMEMPIGNGMKVPECAKVVDRLLVVVLHQDVMVEILGTEQRGGVIQRQRG